MPDNIEDFKALVISLFSKIAEQEKRIAEQDNKIAELEKENKELRMRLNLNSHNSSKPPSTDGLKKKPAFPKEKNGKQGGQKQHNGDTLKMVANPDFVEVLKPAKCQCGQDLTKQEYKIVNRRQLFELPVPKLDVTEYQTTEVICPSCGKIHKTDFPQGINAPTQYGTRAKMMSTLFNNSCKLSYESSSLLFFDIFGYSINESTITTANQTCYEKLAPIEEQFQERIIESETVNEDETGIRCQGKLKWLHVSSTALFTYLFVHNKRGKEAIESEKSILHRFFGWLVHDCWSSYFGLTHLKHAICGAHLLRELQNLIENNSLWAKDFKVFLLDIYKMPIEKRIENRTEIERKYDLIVQQAEIEEPQPFKTGKKGKLKRTKGRNLLIRLQKFKEAVLAFAFNKEVPFTNNQAERDIRPVKVKQKISGSFRTMTGAEHYARIAGFISTVRKHNLNVFKELCNAYEGKFVLPL